MTSTKRLIRSVRPAQSIGADEVSALIRTTGVKVTRGRVRVLGLLKSARQPLSHQDLEAALAGEAGESMDRVTLYRVLDTLVEAGLALKAVDTRGVFRYSCPGASIQHGGHVHFRCVACGGVFCLNVAPPKPPVLPQGFLLHEVEFDVRGTCVGCSRAGV